MSLDEINMLKVRQRQTRYNWSEFIEQLYKHPNKWAEFPQKVTNSASAYRVQATFKDIRVIVTRGNNLPSDNEKKVAWTVYMCYSTEEDTF